MKVLRVDRRVSPIGTDRVRLVGEMTYGASGRPTEEIWFDVPERFAGGLSHSGNPWLAALLPLAFTLQESIEVSLPVDPMLLEGASALLQVWQGWYPRVGKTVALHAPAGVADMSGRTPRTAAFFSAGIDSFYTLLRHEPDGDAIHRLPIDDLLTVWGLDIPLSAPAAFDRLSARIADVAAQVGKTPVTIATNLRESGWRTANWGRLSQGSGLAAIALALEGRFSQVLIPSSIAYHSVTHWGTHPFTDALHATTTTDIRNDGALARRFDKIEAVSHSPFAMSYLHACWFGEDDANCGRCEKCMRTLTSLELIGARDRAVTFPPDTWSLETVAALRLRQDVDRDNSVRLRDVAEARGRADIVRAVERSLRNYHVRREANRLARMIGLRPAPQDAFPL